MSCPLHYVIKETPNLTWEITKIPMARYNRLKVHPVCNCLVGNGSNITQYKTGRLFDLLVGQQIWGQADLLVGVELLTRQPNLT